ncbi:l-fucose permease [Moniliophthora roreri MCA 2997]|uniref:L-fucose permease n=1 Tax=Moniliophthora roreri (strain MCA 2997) TaxID=1381753 RepID=V2YC28_MONRO|nr:l-fucose permease [Moniliophthora roreri MCA 2997]
MHRQGLAYGLLDTLNKQFQNTLGITRTRSSGLRAAYFGAYPLASLGYGNWVLRHYGYRAVFILGLVLYGIGAFCMWPAGLKASFGGFCGATFVIGSGLGCLETAANPYMAVTGPPRYAEMRINLAQAIQAVGTVVGPVLGSYVFFKKTDDSVDSLKSVQWVDLHLSLSSRRVEGIFYLGADMAEQAQMIQKASEESFRKQYRLFHVAWAQFCYTGAQVAIAGYFINYVTEVRSGTDSALGAKFLAAAQGCFAVGRFLGTATLMICFFFESVCFPTIVALGIRGLGQHTKRGSGWIVAGVSGGACVPPLLGHVADMHNTAYAMIVPVMFFASALTYAIAVNFVPAYRVPIDSTGEVGIAKRDPESASVQSDEKVVIKA